MPATHWKTDIPDIRNRAQAVLHSPLAPMTARMAACSLLGLMSLVASELGVDAMQRACADLVRCDAAWETQFGTLPRGADGRVPRAIYMIALGARGMLQITKAEDLRSALSFWASESDPAVWQRHLLV